MDTKKPAVSIQDVLARRRAKGIIQKPAIERKDPPVVREVPEPPKLPKDGVESAQSKPDAKKPKQQKRKSIRQRKPRKLSDKKAQDDERLQSKNQATFILFLDWLATPPIGRSPKTQKEFAALHGVSEDSLSIWKNREGFWDAFRSRMKSKMRENIPEVLHSLLGTIKREGKGRDAMVFFQYVDEFNPKTVIVDETPQRGVLTEEQAAQIAEAAQRSGMKAVIAGQKSREQEFLDSEEDHGNGN